MRAITPSRKYGESREKDVQYLIDEKPTTITIARASGNSLTGGRTGSTVTTFQCRIEVLAMGPRYVEERDRMGSIVNVTWRLIARPVTDKNGNTVDIKHGDVGTIAGKPYRVLYVDRSPYMTEAILEGSQ